jgi:hypothetical protein
MKPNSNESQDINNINEENKDFEKIFEVILFFLFLPVGIAHYQTIHFSTRESIWRIKEYRKEIAIALTILTPISVIFLWLGITRFSTDNYYFSLLMLAMYWVCLIPLALLVSSFGLSKIAGDISESRFPIKYLAATQSALLSNAFSRANREFIKLNRLLPIYCLNGRSVLGVDAHPRDFRFRQMRKRLPDRYVMDSIKSGELIVFNQDPQSPKSQLVIGGTGSGKTRLLSRMALASLAEDWRVVVVDFKGGDEEKMEFSSLPSFLPEKTLNVKNFPGDPIDMFRGSRIDIADRLISCLPAPTGGDGDYHRQRAIRAINAVIIRTGADIPRDVEEVLNRIRNGEAYADDLLDREMFKQKEKGIPVGQILAESIASRFEPLRKSGEWTTSGGFSWSDDWDLAVFSLDATREQEVRLGDLILMDFDMWLKSSERERQPKPILLICDEAGVLEKLPLGSVNLLNIVARGRSSRVGVVIASQTLASLGANYVGLNEQIGTKWIGRTSNPEELINTIGTRDVVEASYEWDEQGWQLPKSGRQQRSYIVDPDVIRGLRTFYWNVSEAGTNRFIYAPPLKPR